MRRPPAALRSGGVLAFTTGGHACPAGFDPFFTQIQRCYQAIGEARGEWPPPVPEEICDEREEIEQSGYFQNVRVTRCIWVEEFTADEYVAMMITASDHQLVQPAKREQLFTEMRRLIEALPEAASGNTILPFSTLPRKCRELARLKRSIPSTRHAKLFILLHTMPRLITHARHYS